VIEVGRLHARDPWREVIADPVAQEKLFGPNPPRAGAGVLGGWLDGRLVGVASWAGSWLKLLHVAPQARDRGVGGALLEACEEDARAADIHSFRTYDHPGNYRSPGLPADTPIDWLLRRGYREVARNRNLYVPLGDNPLVTRARADELAARAAAGGLQVIGFGDDVPIGRQVPGPQPETVYQLAAQAFSPVWAFECRRALAGAPGGLWTAWRGERPVAFAAHDGNNKGLGWFGPAGTLPEERGRGAGEALLIECLLDIERRGRDHAVIAWIGPEPFYRKAAGAEPGGEFVVLAKELP